MVLNASVFTQVKPFCHFDLVTPYKRTYLAVKALISLQLGYKRMCLMMHDYSAKGLLMYQCSFKLAQYNNIIILDMQNIKC